MPPLFSSTSLAFCLTVSMMTAGPSLARDASATESGRLRIDHLFELGEVSDPRISPEGDWIAYTVTRRDLEKDESRSQVLMVPASGGPPVVMTRAEMSSSYIPNARWSPDGRYLAFLSARNDGPTQLWSLYRGGGEAVKLTDTAQSIQSFEWSPDASQILLLLQDPSPQELAAKEQGDDYEEKTAPPWVIDRIQFKADYEGYLDRRRTHIHLLDLASREIRQLTYGDYDDSEAVWSPDGKSIAFTSNRTEEPDTNYNDDIWVVSVETGALTRVTSNPGTDANPAWSPDGKHIAHTATTDVEAMLYATSHLAVSPAGGGGIRVLTLDLDRMVFAPRFSPDGRHIWFMLEDGGELNLARIEVGGGPIERVIRGENTVSAFDLAADGGLAALLSRPHLPPEVFWFSGGELSQRTFTNRELLSGLVLGEVEKVQFGSSEGIQIEGFVIKPPGFSEGRRYPVILDIHGGPQSQYDHSFNFEGQLYAANGYVVAQPNPRGSTGYGQDFCLAIWQDWGGPDYEDVMAAVEDVIVRGWGDPQRMGVTGWSYGGMLTNHIITKTDRFKAAITGASATLYVANYGHDQYQRWWEYELGYPWEPEARKIYERMSPFNEVGRVVTPTLIIGGEEDWNVPIINSEQLYLALKKRGIETQLIVYPGEYHGIDTPSHEKDLYQRYLDWFGRYLGSQ